MNNEAQSLQDKALNLASDMKEQGISELIIAWEDGQRIRVFIGDELERLRSKERNHSKG